MALDQRLKLIFSADLIGSTSIKQRFQEIDESGEGRFDWPDKIERFYAAFEEHVVNAVERFDDACYKYLRGIASDPSSVTNAEAESLRKELFGPSPVFWKTVGDEVLYWKVVETPLQLVVALCYWLRVVDCVRKELNPHWNGPGLYLGNDGFLDVKSTAWLASFPIRNLVTFKSVDQPRHAHDSGDFSTIVAKEEKGRDYASLVQQLYSLDDEPESPEDEYDKATRKMLPHYDFIGPAIDTGFRISSFSDTKKMTLDVSIVYMLSRIFSDTDDFAEAVADNKIQLKDDRVETICREFFPAHTGFPSGTLSSRLRVYYSGSEPLKGVAGGNPYPKFWINSAFSNSYEMLKEDATWGEIRKGSSWSKLAKFTDVYFAHRRKFALRPFFEDSSKFPVSEEYKRLKKIFEENKRKVS